MISRSDRRDIMNRRGTLTLTTMTLLCLGAFSNARADETVKFRAILHATFVQSQDVGDVDSHTISLTRYSGIASFPDGATATGYFVAVADYIKGAGSFSLYNHLTLNDGSVLWYKMTGTTTVQGTISHFQGTVSVLGGKGRFDGAKGEGTMTGARTVPLATGADQYQDLVINVKK
jgi:hypothetical protein